MRPIKFRGLGKYGEYHDKWVYGNLIDVYNSNSHESELCIVLELEQFSYGEANWENVIPVDPSSVGQFTGQIDKNDRDIYEDDVVTLKDNRVAIVSYQKNLCGFYADFHTIDHWDMEVIGNIHDNPQYNR